MKDKDLNVTEVEIRSFLTSALKRNEGSSSHPGRITPGDRSPVPTDYEARVGLKAGMDADAKRKILFPCRNLNPVSSSR